MPNKEFEVLKVLELSLSKGKFGNSNLIIENTNILYKGIAELVSFKTQYTLESISNSSNSFIQILLRASLDESLYALQNGNREKAISVIKTFLNFYSKHIEEIKNYPVSSSLIPIKNFNGRKRLILEIQNKLDSSMRKDGFNQGVEIVEPNNEQLKIIDNSLKIMMDLLPNLGKSTLDFVKTFAIVKSDFESAYNKETPMMFMLNQKIIHNPIITAEFLLHESLHQKLNDIQLTYQLMPDKYDDLASERNNDVLIPWGSKEKRPFSIARAFATYHVYIHLLLYYSIVLSRKKDLFKSYNLNDFSIKERFIKIYHRSRFLSIDLERSEILNSIEQDAKEFKKWLDVILNEIFNISFYTDLIKANPKITFH
jgi:hypothetical protein